ncbi:MAG TPA: hypothetical protein VFU29_11870 [Chitinophagaceae bacterium]|nr:hypothetical protein [Chitinophagaceae bacterium]
MRQNNFYVSLSIRTPEGFESFGRFNLGNKRKAAVDVFRQLKGNPAVDEKTLLTIDLVETVNGLPLNLNILGCTLEELAYNCRVITKETFKLYNLKQA